MSISSMFVTDTLNRHLKETEEERNSLKKQLHEEQEENNTLENDIAEILGIIGISSQKGDWENLGEYDACILPDDSGDLAEIKQRIVNFLNN